eukprot:m.124247 g.124247  ORF g.124247 m.124247 type:complete len:57 (-) comp23413_c0_seq11:35-205(-)
MPCPWRAEAQFQVCVFFSFGVRFRPGKGRQYFVSFWCSGKVRWKNDQASSSSSSSC